ncbi:hypothetical protein ZWY2020_015814 [Hordeum vulgare]|nr:hypothetical protein ZWY2020_015814 [Hordeum vulgare]
MRCSDDFLSETSSMYICDLPSGKQTPSHSQISVTGYSFPVSPLHRPLRRTVRRARLRCSAAYPQVSLPSHHCRSLRPFPDVRPGVTASAGRCARTTDPPALPRLLAAGSTAGISPETRRPPPPSPTTPTSVRMVTAEAVMAVVRAARPVFCCAHDGVAFAANAAFLADGYSLCAVGPAALINPQPAEEEEVGIDGWNSMNNIYAFLYCKEEEGKKKFILMKCVVIADFLAIDALDLEAQHEGPFIVQINVKDFYSEEQHKNYKDMYKNFVCLINILNTTLLVELGRKDTTAVQIPDVENSSSMNSSGNFTWENPSTRTTEPAGLIYPPVVLVGDDDTFPVPGVGLYPHSGGTGGSMHVGPNDPRFFPTNPSTPFGDLGYPDAPGFEPSRFVSPSRHSGGSTHPDLEFFQQGPDFF